MRKIKLSSTLRNYKKEHIKQLVIFLLASLLIVVAVFNIKTFSRVFNMFNYDKYLNSLYELKTKKGLGELCKINADCIAYIECEDLDMHLPVVKTSNIEDENYYLDHDFKKRKNELGSPYQKSSTNIEETTVATFVGHSAYTQTIFNSTKNQSIFGKLNQYLYSSTNYNHLISVETLNAKYTYKVVSVIKFNATNGQSADEMKIYGAVNLETQSQFDDFYNNLKSHSAVDNLEPAEFGDKFLTLFTCATSNLDFRVMVVAKQIQKISL